MCYTSGKCFNISEIHLTRNVRHQNVNAAPFKDEQEYSNKKLANNKADESQVVWVTAVIQQNPHFKQ